MAREHDREILRLAVPAFLALVAEPLFLLADSAIVGHLGTAPLAGLGVASAALVPAGNVFVSLAYGTTSVVARQLGAGSERAAVGAGVDGLWLALALGIPTAVVAAVLADPPCPPFRRAPPPRAVRPAGAGAGPGGALPAGVRGRHPRHARRPRGHRRPARPPGHPH